MAREFNGSTDFIRHTNIIDPGAQGFTVMAWFYCDVLDVTRTLLSQEDGTGTGRTWFYVTSSGWDLGTYMAGASLETGYACSAGVWYLGMLDIATGGSDTLYIRMFDNGWQVNSATRTVENANGVHVLGETKAGAQQFDGKLAEVAIWKRQLSQGERDALANKYSPLFFADDLVLYAPLIRSMTNRMYGPAASYSGTTVSPHLDIIYPAPPLRTITGSSPPPVEPIPHCLTPGLINELGKASPELETLLTLGLDSGEVIVSQTPTHGTPLLESVSSVQHKLQPAYGKANIAKINAHIIDRSFWGRLVSENYIKNRRVNVKVGPRGGAPDSFYTYFTGLLTDFDERNDVLELEVSDDLYVAKAKVPEENETKTQTLAFQNQNPMDIKKALLNTHGGIASAHIDSDAFEYEKTQNFAGWVFERVLTKPVAIKKLIDELDEQTLNFVFTDGDRITTATFAPPAPSQTVLSLEDAWEKESLVVKGSMGEHFVNKCVVYYDYNESGGDGEEDFDAAAIVVNAVSQDAVQWNEVSEKVIKSKWMKSRTIGQPINITGVVVYHCNPENPTGSGTLTYNNTNKTLTWAAPTDSAGATVKINKNGQFQLFSNDTTMYIRVVVERDSLPASNQSDTLAVALSPGGALAGAIASHWVARYADPQAVLEFDLDLSAAIYLDKFIKVSDVIKITSERIVTKGLAGWVDERLLLASARPDLDKRIMRLSGLQTTFKKRYGFIGPSSLTVDYDAASVAEREYAFVGDSNNEVGAANDDGYYIW